MLFGREYLKSWETNDILSFDCYDWMRGGTAVFSRDRHFEFYIRVLAEIENSLNFERLYHPSTKYSAKTCTVKRAY